MRHYDCFLSQLGSKGQFDLNTVGCFFHDVIVVFDVFALVNGLLVLEFGAVQYQEVNHKWIGGFDYILERVDEVVKGEIAIQ